VADTGFLSLRSHAELRSQPEAALAHAPPRQPLLATERKLEPVRTPRHLHDTLFDLGEDRPGLNCHGR
jgi:hypothetical protein